MLVKNPLAYITEHEFLFTNNRKNAWLEIDAGIARYICRFYPFLMELTESRWETLLRSLEKNADVLGEKYGQSLRDFLFHSEERESLEKVRNFLWSKLGQQTCFYCGARLREKDAQTDHFIPFSLCQDTKVFNFVLACGRCNASKSNYLASADHVEHWMLRNRERGELIIRSCPESLDPGAALSANRAHMLDQRAQEKHDLLWRKRALGNGESPLMVAVSAGLVADLARYAQFMNRLELGMSETDFAAPHLKWLGNTS